MSCETATLPRYDPSFTEPIKAIDNVILELLNRLKRDRAAAGVMTKVQEAIVPGEALRLASVMRRPLDEMIGCARRLDIRMQQAELLLRRGGRSNKGHTNLISFIRSGTANLVCQMQRAEVLLSCGLLPAPGHAEIAEALVCS